MSYNAGYLAFGFRSVPLYRIEGQVFLFIHIPKCAGTTIEHGLEDYTLGLLDRETHSNYGFYSPQHYHAEILEKILNLNLIEFSFSIVRNPIDRFVSEYRFQVQHFGLTMDINRWGANLLKKAETQPHILDNHVRPQSDFILPDTNVFQLENGLQSVWNYIYQMTGHRPSIPTETKINFTKNIETTIDSDLLGQLRNFYQIDFDRFGYI